MEATLLHIDLKIKAPFKFSNLKDSLGIKTA